MLVTDMNDDEFPGNDKTVANAPGKDGSYGRTPSQPDVDPSRNRRLIHFSRKYSRKSKRNSSR